ncbi:MAG: hypothetical protein F6J93_10105 [Oscillatoria sp. SIO1A7]|nr:hypothetical protein [Oscillatoria sp. SIO1A7]
MTLRFFVAGPELGCRVWGVGCGRREREDKEEGEDKGEIIIPYTLHPTPHTLHPSIN